MPKVNTVKGASPAEDNKGQLSQISADNGLRQCRLWRDNPEKRPAMADGIGKHRLCFPPYPGITS